MDALNSILGILSSILSIVATTVAVSCKKDLSALRDSYEKNKLIADGDGNFQVVGSGNKVNANGNR